MYCKVCGQKFEVEHEYCNYCGNVIINIDKCSTINETKKNINIKKTTTKKYKIIRLVFINIIFIILLFLAYYIIINKNIGIELSTTNSKRPILYKKLDKLIMYFPLNKQNIKMNTIDKYAVINESNMYYTIDNVFYHINKRNSKKHIDDSVSNFQVKFDSGIILYQKNNNNYILNLKNNKKDIISKETSFQDKVFVDKKLECYIWQTKRGILQSANGIIFKTIYNNTSDFISFLDDNTLLGEKEGNHYSVYKIKEKKKQKVFETQEYRTIDFNYKNNDGKLLYYNNNKEYFLFNGKKNKKIASNLILALSNNQYENRDVIRCVIQDDKYNCFLWDEISDKLFKIKTLKAIEAINDNYTTMICTQADNHIILYHYKKNKWIYQDLTSQIDLKQVKDIKISEDGKRILFIGDELTFLEVNKKPITITKNYQDFTYSNDLKRIIFSYLNNLYQYTPNNKIKFIGQDIDKFEISKDGNRIVMLSDDLHLFIINEHEKKHIATNVKKMINYDGDVIYFIDTNKNLYSYENYNENILKISEKVQDLEYVKFIGEKN